VYTFYRFWSLHVSTPILLKKLWLNSRLRLQTARYWCRRCDNSAFTKLQTQFLLSKTVERAKYACDCVTGEWRKLHNEELHNLYSSPDIIKSKSKAVPLHAMEAFGGERRYSSYSFSTSALDGGEWSASRPGRAFTPGKGPPVPIVQEAGWAPEPIWTQRIEEKSFAPAGNRIPIARSSSP
jgi:hypothetical protein